MNDSDCDCCDLTPSETHEFLRVRCGTNSRSVTLTLIIVLTTFIMSRSYLHTVDRVAIFLLILISTVFQAVLYIDMVKREDGRRGGHNSAEAAIPIETR